MTEGELFEAILAGEITPDKMAPHDTNLIERLAREAGMTDLCAGMRFRSGDDPAVSAEHLARFAALVAAECAKEAADVCADFSDLPDRPEASDFSDAIRARFPMP